ncbi:conjugal transfer protein TrbE [Enterobacter chuandaensis]|uniref:conjugal transfer protein TrbE n=1 Tax=Enterobacter chuandaensis TaxID=2497875 RepID=UPI001C2E30F4|nr:conjugal transfer protein TrbE [Enterobacter chuandaensis]
MKIKGFIVHLIISLIVASPVLYWCGNIVDETTRIDVFFMALMVVLFVAGVLQAWLLNPLFKR